MVTIAFLQEIQVRVLSVCSRKIEFLDPNTVFSVASGSLKWFDNLVAFIDYIKNKLPFPILSLFFLVNKLLFFDFVFYLYSDKIYKSLLCYFLLLEVITSPMPDIFIFGGCNGSGKTTIANTILSTFSNVEFVNADIIAAQLNPNNVDAAAIQASRLMIERLNTLSLKRANFAFETTLAARTFAKFLRDCQTEGYRINLIYVWLESVELAINRVKKRVKSGGHDIPVEVIRRRYERGKNNLTQLYLPLANRFQAYDNSTTDSSLIAYRSNLEQGVVIIKQDKWNQIVNS